MDLGSQLVPLPPLTAWRHSPKVRKGLAQGHTPLGAVPIPAQHSALGLLFRWVLESKWQQLRKRWGIKDAINLLLRGH